MNMEIKILETIARQLNVQVVQVEHALELLEQGCTLPFIARYRKEYTKGLDEEQIQFIKEQYDYQLHLQKRKEEVLEKIATLGRLDDNLKNQVLACEKLVQVEELYRPYKQNKKTRAGIAIANGLEPLAKMLYTSKYFDEAQVDSFLNENVKTKKEALQQAQDILAEQISLDEKVRNKVYDSMYNYGRIVTKEKKQHNDTNKIYSMYYDHSERVSTIENHRVLAIDRAQKEKVIQVSIEFNEEYIENWVMTRKLKYPNSAHAPIVKEAILDGLKRLVYPAMERQVRSNLTERAQEQGISLFAMNLEKLLCQPPMKNKRILGLDPAFRTGCKLAVIDESGQCLHIDVIYPHKPTQRLAEAKRKLVSIVQDYDISLIAIGNGTASRESESFVAQVIQEQHLDVQYTIVSESGASVYSASKEAIREFPNLQVEQRSAISIARRLSDPLSEWIKIDPRSIGVGQYQHDLPSAKLKERLTFVIEKVVNRVGVNINTASDVLLSNVAGLNASIGKSIVEYRQSNGKITNRNQILDIPKIGKKAFEQAAGFLRIEGGDQPLDRTSIHPESYNVANKVLDKLCLSISDMGTEKARKAIEAADVKVLASDCQSDAYTIRDILEALKQPLRDYRDQYDAPILRNDILHLEDLKVHDMLEGTVRNVVDFGAFVDIGLHDDGLVHRSKMAPYRIQHPSQIVSVGDIVQVWVDAIDLEKHQVKLTMIKP